MHTGDQIIKYYLLPVLATVILCNIIHNFGCVHDLRSCDDWKISIGIGFYMTA